MKSPRPSLLACVSVAGLHPWTTLLEPADWLWLLQTLHAAWLRDAEAAAPTQAGVCQRKADMVGFSCQTYPLVGTKCSQTTQTCCNSGSSVSAESWWNGYGECGVPVLVEFSRWMALLWVALVPCVWLAQRPARRKALPHLQRMCKTPSGFQLKPRDLSGKFSSICACVDSDPHKNFGDSSMQSYRLDCEFIVHRIVKWFLWFFSPKSWKPEQSLFLILISLFLNCKGV